MGEMLEWKRQSSSPAPSREVWIGQLENSWLGKGDDTVTLSSEVGLTAYTPTCHSLEGNFSHLQGCV